MCQQSVYESTTESHGVPAAAGMPLADFFLMASLCSGHLHPMSFGHTDKALAKYMLK